MEVLVMPEADRRHRQLQSLVCGVRTLGVCEGSCERRLTAVCSTVDPITPSLTRYIFRSSCETTFRIGISRSETAVRDEVRSRRRTGDSARTLGNEPCVVLDFSNADQYVIPNLLDRIPFRTATAA